VFHQVEQHVSRFRNRTRGRFGLQMVIRMPYGGGIRAVEHHSESREAEIFAERDRKLAEAREWRKARREALRCGAVDAQRSTDAVAGDAERSADVGAESPEATAAGSQAA